MNRMKAIMRAEAHVDDVVHERDKLRTPEAKEAREARARMTSG